MPFNLFLKLFKLKIHNIDLLYLLNRGGQLHKVHGICIFVRPGGADQLHPTGSAVTLH